MLILYFPCIMDKATVVSSADQSSLSSIYINNISSNDWGLDRFLGVVGFSASTVQFQYNR